MADLQLFAITPDNHVLEELERLSSLISSPAAKLWKKGRALFYKETAWSIPDHVSVSSTFLLKLFEDREAVYVLDADRYSLEGLKQALFPAHAELVLLHVPGACPEMDMEAKLGLLVNQSVNLSILRKPLMRIEFEALLSHIMKKRAGGYERK